MISVYAVALILLAACSNNSASSTGAKDTNAAASSNQLSVAGSTALLPLVKQAAQEYQSAHSDVKISVSGGGSRVGLTQAAQKGIDIGDSDIPPAPGQTGLIDHKVAVATFAVIANPAAGVKNLTKQQIRDIFSGKVTNWTQAGGADQKITIINRPKSSGTRAVLVSSIMGNAQPTENSLTEDSSGTVVTTVAQTPGAISYVATGYLRKGNVSTLSIEGVAPSEANVIGGKYAFWSYEHMYTNGPPSKGAADFISYVAADTAIIRQLGFVPMAAMKK